MLKFHGKKHFSNELASIVVQSSDFSLCNKPDRIPVSGGGKHLSGTNSVYIYIYGVYATDIIPGVYF